jgi:simple sugar transport system permease protein
MVAAVLFSATRLLPRLLKGVSAQRDREIYLLAVIGIGLLVALASANLGLSLGLGAFVAGLVLAVLLWLLMARTTFGFAARVTGGNPRAALAQGLPVGGLILTCSAISGACAGLAGFFEVAAVHGQANASLVSGYGFSGVLVSFLARHNPLAIVPIAILIGALEASGGLIQRRMDLPDATMALLQGLIFVLLLASDTLFGRFAIFREKEAR